MKPITLLLISFFVSANLYSQNEKHDTLKTYHTYEDAIKHPQEVFRLDISNVRFNPDTLNLSPFNNLTYLRLHHDSLTTVPKCVFMQPNIKVLDLSDNYIQFLPRKIRTLKQLQELNLEENTAFDLSKNIKKLRGMSSLKSLYVPFNNMVYTSINLNNKKHFSSLKEGENFNTKGAISIRSSEKIYFYKLHLTIISHFSKLTFNQHIEKAMISRLINSSFLSSSLLPKPQFPIRFTPAAEENDVFNLGEKTHNLNSALLPIHQQLLPFYFPNLPVEGHHNHGAGFRFSF